MKKLTTNVSFTVSKNENKETSKVGFINPTVSNSLNKVSDFSKIGEISSKFSNLEINKIEDVLSSVKKPIIKKPIFSNTINKDSIKESFKIPISKIKIPNLSKEEKIVDQEEETNQSEEEFDLDLPRSEIVSLIDFKPLLNNNNTLTTAGNHFKYQLVYLNANKLLINNDIKKYFSQNNKDLSNLDDLKTMLKLINDKSYSNINFDLYTSEYFEKIINITDYSIEQIKNFYSKINDINKKFIKDNELINLIKSKDLEIIDSFSSNKLYGLGILLLDEKLSIQSRKLLKRQTSFASINRKELLSLNEKLYFDINLENKVGSLPTEYKNLKLNDKMFDLKFAFDSDIDQRITTILDYMIYESYKENNINSVYKFSEKSQIINSKQIKLETQDYNKGVLLSLLTSYHQINSDDKQRYLVANKESETYVSKIFEEIISTNFNENSIELLGNEININQNEQQTDKNKIISKLGNLSKKVKFDRSLINSIENGENNQPPVVNSLLRKISKNLKNYNFIKYENNLNSIISIIKELIAYYNDQVQFSINTKDTFWNNIGDHPTGNWKHVIGGPSDNGIKVKHLTDALRFIHFDYEGKTWKPTSEVSNYYVPYGKSEENIANFIGFLTYLNKRTSKNPGQYSRDLDLDSLYYKEKNSTDYNNVKFTGNYFNDGEINKSYWLTFNELIKTINDPENEFSSNKNPFYQKFSQAYVNILKTLNINDLSYSSYDFNSTIIKNNEQLFLMFNCFVFLTDLIKELFKFESTTHWHIALGSGKWYFISKSNNSIGIAGELTGGNDIIFYKDLNKTFPEKKYTSIPTRDNNKNPTDDSFWQLTDDAGDAPCQRFNALDVKFLTEDPINKFNTLSSKWKDEFIKTKNLYSYFNNNLNQINSLINDLLSLDYDLLRFMIDPKFSLNKRSFFMTRFQFNDLKEKYNKIKNNEINYLIDNQYNENYYSIIQKSFSNQIYKELGKNAKIMTFGIPNDIKESNEIIVTIYRKNLTHDDLIFKPIQKSFNLNLFCNLTNLYEKVDITDLIRKSDYYYFNNDLSFNKVSENDLSTKFNNEILNNHFYSEMLNEYIKIMCGLEINDFTLIKDFPIIDSEEVLTNISGIINANDESKKRLLSLRNKVTKFINPLEFRSHLFSNCIFERVFSLLIDPDDFEIDTSNWNKKGWYVNNLTSLPFNVIKVNTAESMFSSEIPFAQSLPEETKIYLENSENIVDSYKIKIDKK